MRPRLFGLVVVVIGYLLSPLPAFAVETVSYLHQDHLGSTALVTDSSGNVVDQEVYYPYGSTRNQLLATGYPLTTRHYTGQVSDVEDTNLYYYNARYYSPTAGKFTSADTVQGPNRYMYVGNNPLKHTDPTGHQCMGSECTWQNWWTQPTGSWGSESQSGQGLNLEIDPQKTNDDSRKQGVLGEPLSLQPTLLSWENEKARQTILIFWPLSLAKTYKTGKVPYLTQEGIESPEFKDFKQKVSAQTNFEAETELEFVQSFAEAFNDNAVYDQYEMKMHFTASTQNRQVTFKERLAVNLRRYMQGDSASRVARDSGICGDFALIIHYLLGQYGLHSQVWVNSDPLHYIVKMNFEEQDYVIDSTTGNVLLLNDYLDYLFQISGKEHHFQFYTDLYIK